MAPPAGLRVGPVLGGFEAEGGFNGPDQPANNWCWWDIEGRSASRPEGRFWADWAAEVAAAAAAGVGIDTVRVAVEWSRCVPLDGQVDRRALDTYCRLLDRCHEVGLQPVVVLHRFAHPAWMGVNLWMRPDAPERFCAWVETAVDHFAGRVHRWVTVDQLNAAALRAYATGRHPPGRRLDVGATIRALDHLLAAHVLAYEVVKDRQPQSVVAASISPLPVYELGALLVDILLARQSGVTRHDLHGWLLDRQSQWSAGQHGRPGAGLLRRLAGTAIPLGQALARTVAAVYDGAAERPLDLLELAAEPVGGRDLFPRSAARAGRRPAYGRLRRACVSWGEVGVPLAVVGDTAVGTDQFVRRRAEVGAARAAGAPVTAYYQRLTPDAVSRLTPANGERAVPAPLAGG